MKNIMSGTDTLAVPSETENKPCNHLDTLSKLGHQIHDQSTCENPLTKFWLATLNENKQGQKLALAEAYALDVQHRRQTGARVLPCTQLLEALRCYAIQHELPLYGVLRKRGNCKLQHN